MIKDLVAGTNERAVSQQQRARPRYVDRVMVSIPLDPYLSLRALADYSGLSIRKLRELLTDPARPLPYYRVGSKLLVRRSEFDGWMTQHRAMSDVDSIVGEVLGELRH